MSQTEQQNKNQDMILSWLSFGLKLKKNGSYNSSEVFLPLAKILTVFCRT